MFAVVSAWLTAAKAAVEAALPSAFVIVGPLVTSEDIGGRDIVVLGYAEDFGPRATDEPSPAFEYEGGWHDSGLNAATSGEVRVPVTLLSTGQTYDMAAQIAASGTLHAAVLAALVPSPAGSALGVSGLMWAQETAVAGYLVPFETGSGVRLVCTFTLATLVE